MHLIPKETMPNIIGGYSFVIAPAIGCAGFSMIQYAENNDSSYSDLGKSCVRGAMHGANPGLNLIGGLMTNPYARYAAGIGYSYARQKVADRLFPLKNERQNPDTCSVSFDGQSAFGD